MESRLPRTLGRGILGFGGISTSPSDGVASASVRLTVPTATCVGNAANAGDEALGETVFDTNGTPQAAGNVYIYCSSGAPSYIITAFTPVNGVAAAPAVNPGDKLVISAYETPSNTVAQVVDLTQNVTVTQSDGEGDATGAPSASTMTGVTDFGQPIPDFGTVRFSDLQVNAIPLSLQSRSRSKLENDGVVEATPSSVTMSGFTLA